MLILVATIKKNAWNQGCVVLVLKKMLTTGDGGMICTNNKKLSEKFKSLSYGWNKDLGPVTRKD